MGYSIYHGTVGVGAKPPLRRRVAYNSTNLVQAIVTAASYSVYAGKCGEVIAGHENVALVVADIVYDDLQSWDVDETGFNMEVHLSSELPSPFTEWGKEYLVHVTLVLSDGVVDGIGWIGRTP